MLHGQHHVWGGRATVRAVLYMTTLSAVRYEPIIKTHVSAFTSRRQDGQNCHHRLHEKAARYPQLALVIITARPRGFGRYDQDSYSPDGKGL